MVRVRPLVFIPPRDRATSRFLALAESQQRPHNSRGISADRFILPIAKELCDSHRSNAVDSSEVSFENFECHSRVRVLQQRLQSLENISDFVAVVLQRVDQV